MTTALLGCSKSNTSGRKNLHYPLRSTHCRYPLVASVICLFAITNKLGALRVSNLIAGASELLATSWHCRTSLATLQLHLSPARNRQAGAGQASAVIMQVPQLASNETG